MKKLLSLPILLLLFLACSNDSGGPSIPATGETYPGKAEFQQSWTRSHEEEVTEPVGVQIYRPTDSMQFPPAHFRNRYVFEQGGDCEWLVLHPTDAHYMDHAAWMLDPKDPNIVSIVDRHGVEVVRFKVLELTADRMRIQSLKDQP